MRVAFNACRVMIPPKVAAGLMLTGRRLSAVEAHAWGLVHEVLPAHRLLAAALELATSIATSAPLALRALKATLRQNEQLSIQEALYRARPGNSGLPIVEQMLNSEDFFEGPRAFAEKSAKLEGQVAFTSRSKRLSAAFLGVRNTAEFYRRAKLSSDRNDLRSSLWSRPPRSPSRTSPWNWRRHRRPRWHEAANANRRKGPHACRSI